MSKAEHMGVSPSIVSDQTGNDSCPKQTPSERTCQYCAECAYSEPLELQHHLPGSEAIQNKPQEISTAVATSHTNERFPAFSGDLPDNSLTKHLVLPSEAASKSSQTKEIPCSQQSMSEQKNEFGTECKHKEQSEKKNKLDFKIVLNKSTETSTVECSSVDNENLPSVSEDVSKSSLIETKEALELGSGHRSNEHDAEFKGSELLEQKYQLGSRIIQNEPADTDAMAADGSVTEDLQSLPEDLTKICHTEPLQSLLEDMNSSQNEKNSCTEQPTSEQTLEITAGTIRHEPLEVDEKSSSEHAQNKPGKTRAAISCSIAVGKLGSPSEVLEKSSIEHLKQLNDPIRSPSTEPLAPFCDGMVESSSPLETTSKYVVKNSTRLGCRGRKASKSSKKKYMLRSSRGSDRVLRSRSQEKPKAPESSDNLTSIHSRGRKRIKNQNRRGEKRVPDEYSRIRTHLRYLLNRINYERSLISAYSGEGWKGLSIEKLKPEKELQRATSEILRRKLKIRDLFQRLDSLCAEGRFPESLFDSDGQIDSEDIFCAKCGSKELTPDDDIILCDGACDRGFHQYCLEPPLLKEEIPPDDEGWLCPGCDCKVDCIDMVNDSQGTNLFIADNWEKVFPEAAAGHNQDPNFGLPSDDSDDNDYDPDGPATDEKDQGDETSSDESDFTSASDELEASPINDKYLGLPSDDSEDDDFNPDAPVLDEKATEESSSSDFTSDSEDLAGVLEDKRSSGNDEEGATSVSPLGESSGQRSKCGGNKDSLKNELLSILESGQDGAGHVYEKRNVERLDYKKLYDETYGHVPSDSSDDEDWTDNDGPRKRTKRNGEVSPVAANGDASVPRNGNHTRDVKQQLKETGHTLNIRTHRKLNSEDTNMSPAKSHAGSSTCGSSGKRERSSYRRLGEDVTKRLYNSFIENQYPDRTRKESLANELGITFSQVSKWFENARWSFNHSSSMDARLGNTSEKSTPQSNKGSVRTVSTGNGTEKTEPPDTGVHCTEDSRGDVRNSGLAAHESNQKKSTTQTSSERKRKGEGHQASDPESQIGGRLQTRRKKSVV